MKNLRPPFEEWEGTVDEIDGTYQEIRCQLIFDVNIDENFRRKAKFVAGGHTTDIPDCMTYAYVLTRDSVFIALTLAALNDLKIISYDIQNSYLKE